MKPLTFRNKLVKEMKYVIFHEGKPIGMTATRADAREMVSTVNWEGRIDCSIIKLMD
jgi:hypothetical protein